MKLSLEKRILKPGEALRLSLHLDDCESLSYVVAGNNDGYPGLRLLKTRARGSGAEAVYHVPLDAPAGLYLVVVGYVDCSGAGRMVKHEFRVVKLYQFQR